MCGWNDANKPYDPTTRGLGASLKAKSLRWKSIASVSGVIVVFVFGGIIAQFNEQKVANQAISRAKIQMGKRLYASAARTLNSAPRSQGSVSTNKQLLKNNIKWARDNSKVSESKELISKVQTEDALDTLEDVNDDFPQENEVVELIDVAQEQTFDPSENVTEQELDEIAFVPDDPEQGNIDEIATEAEEESDVSVEETAKEETPPASAIPPSEQPTAQADGETTDLGETNDPVAVSTTEQPVLAEQPDTPTPPRTTPSPAPAPAPVPLLTAFYQLNWVKQSGGQTDQDTFYTIDLAGEVTPKKDKLTNFGGYSAPTVIGQIFNRPVPAKPNIIPLYRYWSAFRTDHYYTTNPKFSSNNKKAKYARQQVAGYVGGWNGTKCLEGTQPLYNIYHSKLGDNFYTPNPAVKDTLIKNHGWVNPKIVGCIW